jgi:peptidoglycan hydrolase CwlO-like protein
MGKKMIITYGMDDVKLQIKSLKKKISRRDKKIEQLKDECKKLRSDLDFINNTKCPF